MYDVRDKMGIMGRVGQASGHRNDNDFTEFAASRTGAGITIDQVLQWAIDGRLFHAQQGNAGTKLAFGQTTYTEDRPEFALRVPAGRVVIPVSLVVTLEDMAGLINNIIWSTATNDIGNSSTSVAMTITPMRTDAPHESACIARSLYTANATAATGLIEIVRYMNEFAAADTMPSPRLDWNIRNQAVIPVLVGPATLQMHAYGATALQGWGEYVWAEFETPALVHKA